LFYRLVLDYETKYQKENE